jgi:hypothetical protein
MFWSSAARNIPVIRPDRMVRICRWVRPSAAGTGGTAAGLAVDTMLLWWVTTVQR